MRSPDRFEVILGRALSLALVLAQPTAVLAQNKHTLPLFAAASHKFLQGFARIINLSDRPGDVIIHAIDDTGKRAGPMTISLEAMETRHFNSIDLEAGNADKGLGGVGSGQGNWWWLELETDLEIDPLTYTRPLGSGFVTSTHDIVAEGGSMRWRVPFFNPASNTAQQSVLRVVNTSGTKAEVAVEGRDDTGESGNRVVRFDLARDAARMLSAEELERGSDDSLVSGRLGDGTGKWQLFVSADRPVQVMGLLLGESGHLTNLSTSVVVGGGVGTAGFAPADQSAFDARFVGKRMQYKIADAVEYADFITAGRVVVHGSLEESNVDRPLHSLAGYAYRNTGSNIGVLDFDFDLGVSCSLQVEFRSASTGTLGIGAPVCAEGSRQSISWHLVNTPAAGFSPADQAAFDARFVGKQWFSLVVNASELDDSDRPDLVLVKFISPGRLEEIHDGNFFEHGIYSYRRTGPNTGALEVVYVEDGIRSTARTWDVAFYGRIAYVDSTAPHAGTFSLLVDGSRVAAFWVAQNFSGS